MFKERKNIPELMDDFSSGGEEMEQALREIRIINQYLGGYQITLKGIEKLVSGKKFTTENPLTIADAGCGRGDMLMIIARWCRKKKIPVKLTGIDANDFIVEKAREQSAGFPEIEFLNLDVFSDKFKEREYDVVTSMLFCHHFTDDELVKMFSLFRRQSKIGVVINDLHRHPLAYYSIKILTQLFSKSEMVKYDAPVSVLRSFKKNELMRLLKSAGAEKIQIDWKWAFRYLIVFQ
jgi:2-polyprenyl-3-methyl-5-hydroxy-6-metoxy-1,4-benzoquinol methylase